MDSLDHVVGFELMAGNLASLKVNGLKQFRYSQRVMLRTGCQMNLKMFPHDKQVGVLHKPHLHNNSSSLHTCVFRVGSYGYHDSYVKFNLSKVVADFHLPEHPVVGLKNSSSIIMLTKMYLKLFKTRTVHGKLGSD